MDGEGVYGIGETVVDTWFERDRAYVILYVSDGEGGFGREIVSWWDGAVAEAVEDGFLDPSDWHGSAHEWAASMSLLSKRDGFAPGT